MKALQLPASCSPARPIPLLLRPWLLCYFHSLHTRHACDPFRVLLSVANRIWSSSFVRGAHNCLSGWGDVPCNVREMWRVGLEETGGPRGFAIDRSVVRCLPAGRDRGRFLTYSSPYMLWRSWGISCLACPSVCLLLLGGRKTCMEQVECAGDALMLAVVALVAAG